MQGDRDRCAAAGMVDFLPKPTTRASLQRVLERWLPDQRRADPHDED
jgi:CheY-like chemotaxis protein